MSIPTLTIGSVCSGYGGLELGLTMVLPHAALAWVADYMPPDPRKPAKVPKQVAAVVLAHRWPGVPNLGDITKVDWSTTAPARIIAGGTPCQDVSQAGARKGMRHDTRSGIWSSMVRAIEHHRPLLVVWENVEGALSAGADSNVEPCPICVGDDADQHLRACGRVVGDLSELGYDACWITVPASDIGACHQRKRVFVLGWPGGGLAEDADRSAGDQRRVTAPGQAAGGRSRPDAGRPGGTAAAANAPDDGQEQPGSPWPGGAGSQDGGSRSATPDADRPGRQGREHQGGQELPDGFSTADPDGDPVREQSQRLTGRGRAPVTGNAGPLAAAGEPVSDTHGRGFQPREPELRAGQLDASRGSSDGVQWGEFQPAIRRWEAVLGRPAPAPADRTVRGTWKLSARFVEWMMGLPAGHVTDVPGLTVNDQLHQLGNGVVPQQFAYAFTLMWPNLPDWIRNELMPA